MSEQREDERGVVWAVLIGVVLLPIGWAVGRGLSRPGKNAGQEPATASSAGVSAGAATAGAAAAASAAPASTAAMASGDVGDGAAIRVEGGVVKFYFASASAELAAGAAEALGEVVKGVAAGKKAVVSGFHDTTGDPARNEELAKQRAAAERWAALNGLIGSSDGKKLPRFAQSLTMFSRDVDRSKSVVEQIDLNTRLRPLDNDLAKHICHSP